LISIGRACRAKNVQDLFLSVNVSIRGEVHRRLFEAIQRRAEPGANDRCARIYCGDGYCGVRQAHA